MKIDASMLPKCRVCGKRPVERAGADKCAPCRRLFATIDRKASDVVYIRCDMIQAQIWVRDSVMANTQMVQL